jgi:hypothetical protein
MLMPVVVTYLLPVELAALLGAAFFVHIAVRDRPVDGEHGRDRMILAIGTAGSTGITSQT